MTASDGHRDNTATGDPGQGRRHPQQQRQGVGQLVEQPARPRSPRSTGQLVAAMGEQTPGGLSVVESLHPRAQLPQHQVGAHPWVERGSELPDHVERCIRRPVIDECEIRIR